MATTKWRGDAMPIRQLQKVSVANVGIGDKFRITCNRKYVEYIAEEATAADVYAGLAALLGENATIAEFTEITPLTSYLGSTDGLWLQGPEDGTPFTVTVSKTNGNVPDVVVTTLTEGVAGANCKQTVTVTATGGNFTLTFQGSTTGNIAYNASAGTVQTALEGLASIGSGNVTVTAGGTTGNTRSWVAEFVGIFANATQPVMTASGAGLTGVTTGQVTEKTKGAPSTSHKFSLTLTGTGGLAKFTFTNPVTFSTASKSCTVNPASATSEAGIIQSCLQSITPLGVGNCTVTRTSQSGSTSVYEIEFINTLRGFDLDGNLTVLAIPPTGGTLEATLETTQTGSATTINEVQVITFSSPPAGGTFTISFNGQTTAAIAYNAADTAVLSALEALSNIAVGDVSVTKTLVGTMPFWEVTFLVNLGATDQPMMTVDATSITGGPADVVLSSEGYAGTNEVQQIELTYGPDGGTFTLTYSGQTTASIAWNADPSIIRAALEALSNLSDGDVDVSGPPAGPYVVTFIGTKAYTNVAQMTGTSSLTTSVGTESISLTDVVSPTGPNWYTEANNWTGGAVPSSADTIIFEDNAVDCKYGMLPGSIPASMTIKVLGSYTGKIGLPEWNESGYQEYRDKRLRIGDTAGTVTINVGQGDGDGSTRLRFNTGAAATTIDVWKTDQSDIDTTRAFDWIGSGTNTVRVHDGQFAVAPYDAETAAIATLTISENADVFVGPGATVTAITTAGDLLTRAPLQTSLTITNGTTESYGSLNSCTIVQTGGTWESHNSGTATAVTVGPGDIDCSDDYTPKTFTTLTIKAGADISDPNKIITATSLVRGTDVQEIITR